MLIIAQRVEHTMFNFFFIYSNTICACCIVKNKQPYGNLGILLVWAFYCGLWWCVGEQIFSRTLWGRLKKKGGGNDLGWFMGDEKGEIDILDPGSCYERLLF